MKKYLALVLLISAMTWFSCDKETPTDPSFLTAKIDGIDYSATIITAIDGVILFEISGIGDQGNMAFGINDVPLTIGTHEFDGHDYIASFERDSDSWTAESGSITITKYENGRIEGTFNFIGDNTLGELDPSAPDIIVTEGRFSTKYL